MSLKQKTASGVLWTGVAKLSMQLFLMANMLILARLLSKEDFGIVGIAAIVTVAVSMVNDYGLGTAVIQRKNNTLAELSSLFWGGIIFGVLLALATILVSFPASWFFKEPIVRAVLCVQSIGFIIGSFGVIQKSLLSKNMQFKKLAILEMIAVFASSILSIVLALLGYGVWSLVFGILVREILIALLVWVSSRWKPILHFSWVEFKSYLGYSSTVLSNNAALYLNTNADVTIIGRVLGIELLGVYTFALYIVKLPVTRLSGIVSKVVFPAFSLVQHDLEKFKHAYLRSMTLISFFTFFILTDLAIFANEFVTLVLPDKWLPIVVPLQILVPMAMLKSIGTIRGSVFMALGRPDIGLKWNIAYFFPLVIAVLLGTKNGLVGVTLAFSILYIATFPIIQRITNKLVSIRALEYICAFKATGPATVIMVVAGFFFMQIIKLFPSLPDYFVLISGTILLAIVYFIIVYLIDWDLMVEIFGLVRNRSTKQKKQAGELPL